MNDEIMEAFKALQTARENFKIALCSAIAIKKAGGEIGHINEAELIEEMKKCQAVFEEAHDHLEFLSP